MLSGVVSQVVARVPGASRYKEDDWLQQKSMFRHTKLGNKLLRIEMLNW